MELEKSSFKQIPATLSVGRLNGADVVLVGYDQQPGNPPSAVVQTSNGAEVGPPVLLARLEYLTNYGIEYHPGIWPKIDKLIGSAHEIPPLPEALKKPSAKMQGSLSEGRG